MSICIFPVFDPSIESSAKTTGEFIGRFMEQLEDVAEDAELVALSTFADSRPAPDDFDGPPWELDEVLGPWDEWFDCKTGASAASALAKELQGNESLDELYDFSDDLVAELEDLARSLLKGAAEGSRFRLEVSY